MAKEKIVQCERPVTLNVHTDHQNMTAYREVLTYLSRGVSIREDAFEICAEEVPLSL